MKLYIKQKAFSWRDKFSVKDESGKDKYYAEGEFFSWGKKLHIFNSSGKEVAFIRKKMWAFLPRYYIEIDGKIITLVKEFSFLRPRFHIEGLAWNMDGNFLAHEYTLSNNQGILMNITKHWFTWGDSYELDISSVENELICLCIALAVDCINADSANSNNHNN